MPDSLSDLLGRDEVGRIIRNELDATIEAAVSAWSRGDEMPAATPLQRVVGAKVVRAWSQQKLEAMRARARH